MDVFYLILTIFANGLCFIILDIIAAKNKDCKKGVLIDNSIICLSSLVCWIIYSIIVPGFDVAIIPYALAFGLSWFCAFLFNQLAMRGGRVSIVTLLVQFSLVLTALYGFVFWDSPITPFSIVGLSLAAISLALIILKKEKVEKKQSIKWLIFAIIAMITNATCSIAQKSQQIAFNGTLGPQTMMLAGVFASALSIILTFMKKDDLKEANIKRHWYLGVIVGVINFSLNLLVIVLANSSLSPTLIYPAISLSLIIVIIYSFFVKKEKISIQQWIGIAVGLGALVLLSL